MGFRLHTPLVVAMSLMPPLAGCELTRPAGAYTPIEMEAGEPLVEFPDGGGDDPPVIIIPGSDGGVGGDGDGTVIPPPTNDAFAGLVGTFMMRFDHDTFSSSKTSGLFSIELSMNTRISRFVLAEIVERDNKLVSTEYLCHQTQKHVCKSSACVSASTQIHPSAARLLPTALPTTRTLTLSEDGLLQAPFASTYLGFDASSDTALPTSTSDARMWDPLPETSGREGLYSDLSITVKPSSIVSAETVRCQVSLVQRLETSWSVRVKSGTEQALHGKEGEFEVGSATSGDVLAAKAQPSNRASDCMGEGASQGSETPLPSSAARFHLLGLERVRTCPTQEDFESALPASRFE